MSSLTTTDFIEEIDSIDVELRDAYNTLFRAFNAFQRTENPTPLRQALAPVERLLSQREVLVRAVEERVPFNQRHIFHPRRGFAVEGRLLTLIERIQDALRDVPDVAAAAGAGLMGGMREGVVDVSYRLTTNLQNFNKLMTELEMFPWDEALSETNIASIEDDIQALTNLFRSLTESYMIVRRDAQTLNNQLRDRDTELLFGYRNQFERLRNRLEQLRNTGETTGRGMFPYIHNNSMPRAKLMF